MSAKDNFDRSSPQSPPKVGKNGLEWMVFALSLILLLGVLGVLVFQTVRYQDSPARIETEIGAATVLGSRVHVPVKVMNRGDRVAQDVQVEVVAGNGDAAVFTVAFVPRGGTSQGWVSFQAAAGQGPFVTRVTGFEEP